MHSNYWSSSMHAYRSPFLVSVATLLFVSRSATGFQRDAGSWEPLHEYRRRLGIEFNYTPRGIHPEVCRHLNQTECEAKDEHVRKLQGKLVATGPIKAIVLLIQTNDNFPTFPREDYEWLFNSGTIDEELNPTGSIKEYFRQNSRDQLDIQFEVFDWVRSANPESECAGNTNGVGQSLVDCIIPALEVLEQRTQDPNDPFNFGDYDLNGDFFIDPIVIIHNGYAAENGAEDPAGNPPENLIRSHATGANILSFRSSAGIRLGLYAVAAGFRGLGRRGDKIMRINVAAHEYIHTFGMIDLYDLSFRGNGCGGYCIMGYPVGQSNSAIYPGNVGAYTRDFLNWDDPIDITSDGTYELEPSFSTGQYYRVRAPTYDPLEYLLIENRQPLGYDINFWGGGGIVIWHVNENAILNDAGRNQERVRIIQADGRNDLEAAINIGDEDDIWVAGSELDDDGVANLRSMVTGDASGLRIFDFSPSQETAQFTIEGLGAAEPTPALQPEPAPVPVPDDPTVVAPIPDEPISEEPTVTPVSGESEAPTVTAPVPEEPTPAEPTMASPVPEEPTPAEPTMASPVPEEPTPAEPMSAPIPAPIFVIDPNQCPFTVGTDACEALVTGVVAETDCDCYNFCDGEYIGCCAQGEECPVMCDGEVVGGCRVVQSDASASPSATPSTTPTRDTDETTSPSSTPSTAPTSTPSSSPSGTPSSSPTLSDETCLVRSGLGACEELMSTVELRDDCFCYNFCNGVELPCCPFFGTCPQLSCNGDFVAGCVAQDQAPVSNQELCFVNVNSQACTSNDIAIIDDATPDCDCYNYCDGEFAGCCPYNTPCGLQCAPNVRSVVAGCQAKDAGPPPTLAPVTNSKGRPFFFWPEGFTAPKYSGEEKRRLLGERSQIDEL